jgi:lipid-binding SYLF domain-containing protein
MRRDHWACESTLSAIRHAVSSSVWIPNIITPAVPADASPQRFVRSGRIVMKAMIRAFLVMAAMAVPAGAAFADSYSDTIDLFKHAGASASYFDNSYGYAVFPTIGKGGFIIGGAHGKGRVYEQGSHVGDTSMSQVSVGFQAGGQAYSQIVFFEDKRAIDEFTSGHFEFNAGASAVAITAAASGTAGTTGADASASGGKKDAATAGRYYKGMAVFTIIKGGAMFEASVAGQKYSYKPRQ